MIRVGLVNDKAYGYDVTGWDVNEPDDCSYNSLLEQDLLERVGDGDIVMYFDTSESAEDWCFEHGFDYELVE